MTVLASSIAQSVEPLLAGLPAGACGSGISEQDCAGLELASRYP